MKSALAILFALALMPVFAETATPATTHGAPVVLTPLAQLMVDRIRIQGTNMNIEAQIKLAHLDPANTSDEIKELRKQIGELQEQLAQKNHELNQKIRKLSKVETLQAEHEANAKRIQELTEQINKLNPQER